MPNSFSSLFFLAYLSVLALPVNAVPRASNAVETFTMTSIGKGCSDYDSSLVFNTTTNRLSLTYKSMQSVLQRNDINVAVVDCSSTIRFKVPTSKKMVFYSPAQTFYIDIQRSIDFSIRNDFYTNAVNDVYPQSVKRLSNKNDGKEGMFLLEDRDRSFESVCGNESNNTQLLTVKTVAQMKGTSPYTSVGYFSSSNPDVPNNSIQQTNDRTKEEYMIELKVDIVDC